MSKAAVYRMIKSLSKSDSGMPAGSSTNILDTPSNRKMTPKADRSTWTPLEFVAGFRMICLNALGLPNLRDSLMKMHNSPNRIQLKFQDLKTENLALELHVSFSTRELEGISTTAQGRGFFVEAWSHGFSDTSTDLSIHISWLSESVILKIAFCLGESFSNIVETPKILASLAFTLSGNCGHFEMG
ncbi:hypothetical protein ACTXT7_013924 [Hymenolepis weldensis]